MVVFLILKPLKSEHLIKQDANTNTEDNIALKLRIARCEQAAVVVRDK